MKFDLDSVQSYDEERRASQLIRVNTIKDKFQVSSQSRLMSTYDSNSLLQPVPSASALHHRSSSVISLSHLENAGLASLSNNGGSNGSLASRPVSVAVQQPVSLQTMSTDAPVQVTFNLLKKKLKT